MKRTSAATLFAASLLVAGLLAGCATVRQLRAPESIPASGESERTRDKSALDYSVATDIDAAPEIVWDILTESSAYLSWNSTLVSLEGKIVPGETLTLVSKDAPDRTFKLKVTAFEPGSRMVWEDGNGMFLGVRTFTLLPLENGKTRFVMSETYSGGMLGMIEKKLPDFRKSFTAFAGDLKKTAEERGAAARAEQAAQDAQAEAAARAAEEAKAAQDAAIKAAEDAENAANAPAEGSENPVPAEGASSPSP